MESLQFSPEEGSKDKKLVQRMESKPEELWMFEGWGVFLFPSGSVESKRSPSQTSVLWDSIQNYRKTVALILSQTLSRLPWSVQLQCFLCSTLSSPILFLCSFPYNSFLSSMPCIYSNNSIVITLSIAPSFFLFFSCCFLSSLFLPIFFFFYTNCSSHF